MKGAVLLSIRNKVVDKEKMSPNETRPLVGASALCFLSHDAMLEQY